MSSSSSSSSGGSGSSSGGNQKFVATSFCGALSAGLAPVPLYAVPTGCHEGTPEFTLQLPLVANPDALGASDILRQAFAQIPLDALLLCCLDQCPSCGADLPCEGG
jgi:hypothetical protein